MKKVSLRARVSAALFRGLARFFANRGHQLISVFFYSEAARRDPFDVYALKAIGKEYLLSNELSAAIDVYKTLLAQNPNDFEALNNLGVAFEKSGTLDRAEECYRHALQEHPAYAAAHNNLGNIHFAESRLSQALASYRSALEADPNYVEAHCNLSMVLDVQADYVGAEKACRKALELNPDYAGAYNNLAGIQRNLGRFEEAIASYRLAVKLDPNSMQAYINLAILTGDRSKLAGALPYYESELKKNPNSFKAHHRVAIALTACNLYDEAQQHFEEALRLNPDFVDSQSSQANNFALQGNVEGALAGFRKSFETGNNVSALQSYLFYLNYLPNLTAEEIFTEHKQWGTRYAGIFPISSALSNKSFDSEKKLRIAYVSADLKSHSVAFFFEPILRAHDRNKFEIYCYSNLELGDDVTERLKSLADFWRDIYLKSPDTVVNTILADGIDILIDLSGHTNGNSMPVFATRAAPVQVGYLGYPNTTGLRAIDYRITDEFADPSGMTDRFYTEKLIRLPDSFLTYQAAEDAPDIVPAPALKADHVTFGSFNNIAKLNESVVVLWSKILLAVPGSRLILKGFSFYCESTKTRYFDLFEKYGINAQRIELVAYIAEITRHLDAYSRVDIALDPFPYNGTTTTCEALWMGVPVICLEGDSHRSRVGVSLLNNVGLQELIATTEADYVDIAVKLANDLPRLQTMRTSMRNRMLNSPLTNAAAFTKNIEAAYCQIWRDWCKTNEDI